MRQFAVVIALVLLMGCSTVVRVPDAAQRSTASLADAERGFGRVLAQHVNRRGGVDFVALRDDRSEAGHSALEAYVHRIAITPVDSFPNRATQLAHLINAYNALSMYNVIASGIPHSHAGLAKVKFFVLRKFEIGGTALSLYAFENDIIRKLGEPRIHFALNCSAISCPTLPMQVFTADTLEATLERETRAFFARADNLRIDDAAQTVFFNEILKFYTEDFVPSAAPDLITYAQRYTNIVIPKHYAVAFSPYDWTVANSAGKR
jgi:hypothetical protein